MTLASDTIRTSSGFDGVLFYKWPIPFCIDTIIRLERMGDSFNPRLLNVDFHHNHIVDGGQHITEILLSVWFAGYSFETILSFHNKQSKLNLWHDDTLGEMLHPELQADRDILQDSFQDYLRSADYNNGLPWELQGYSTELLKDYQTKHERETLSLFKCFNELREAAREQHQLQPA